MRSLSSPHRFRARFRNGLPNHFPRHLLGIIAVLGILCWGASPTNAAQENAKPAAKNVIIFIADDLSLTLGCYGDKNAKTPNLDALAAESTRFTRAFCTTASCSPSRSVLMSGLYNHANGQYGLAHAEHHFQSHAWVRGIAPLLKEGGYRTCLIGKHHVLPMENYQFERTFDKGVMGGRHAVKMAENAASFIQEPDARPFFLYLGSTDPHRARTGFANEAHYPGVTPVEIDPAGLVMPQFLPLETDAREDVAEYYKSVARLDQGVGKLVKFLKESGQWEQTLFIFMSDNGMPFPGAKTGLYEPGVNLPLIVHLPGQKAGLVSSAMITWADILPTVLDYTGAKGPEYPLHGKSFLPAITDPNWTARDSVFLSHTFHEVTMYYPMRAVRNARYKYIINFASGLPYPFASDLYGSPTWQGVLKRGDSRYGLRSVDQLLHRPRFELYDLQADPEETTNLAEKPELKGVRDQLHAELVAEQQRTKDPWILKHDRE